MIRKNNKKELFLCPFQEDHTPRYTTDECGDCFAFWDCIIGLENCLEDPNYSNIYSEIIEALKDL